jgi:hypothetical protein
VYEWARALLERLQTTFSPFEVEVLGLSLWHDISCPWEGVGTYPYAPRPEDVP